MGDTCNKTDFVISLDSMTRLSSFTTRGPIHTKKKDEWRKLGHAEVMRTFFTNKAVVAVIRVIGVTKTAMRVLKLQELVSMFSRVAGAWRGAVGHSSFEKGGTRLTSICSMPR
jgi:hypothetical protein